VPYSATAQKRKFRIVPRSFGEKLRLQSARVSPRALSLEAEPRAGSKEKSIYGGADRRTQDEEERLCFGGLSAALAIPSLAALGFSVQAQIDETRCIHSPGMGSVGWTMIYAIRMKGGGAIFWRRCLISERRVTEAPILPP
jgi:hypothetical protein